MADIATGDPNGGVMLAHRLLVGSLQQAVDLPFMVVVELDLPHSELVLRASARALRN